MTRVPRTRLQFVDGGASIGVEGDRVGCGVVAPSVRCETLDLANSQVAAGGASGCFCAQRLIFNCEQRTRVTRGQASVFYHFTNGIVESQKAKRVGDGCAFLARTLRGFLLRQLKFLNQPIEGLRLFDGIKVFALQIFDERVISMAFSSGTS